MNFVSRDQYGEHAFARAVASLPLPADQRPAAIARWLGVSAGTVRAWLSGRRCPPRAAVLALWLESGEGRAAMHCQLFNESRAHAGHAQALADHAARLTATIDALRRELADIKASGAAAPANDGVFHDARPPGAPRRYLA